MSLCTSAEAAPNSAEAVSRVKDFIVGWNGRWRRMGEREWEGEDKDGLGEPGEGLIGSA